MKGIDIIDSLNDIDEWMIRDAKLHRKDAPAWLRWGSIAVCFCCVFFIGLFSFKNLFQQDDIEVSRAALTSCDNAASDEYAASIDLPDVNSETPLVWRYPDELDLGDCAEYSADGTTLKWFDPVSNDLLQGGGLIWELSAVKIDDFNSKFELTDEWVDYISYNQYMYGRNDEYVYVLTLPGDVQYNSESKPSYLYYMEIGIDVLDEIVTLNSMERNPLWRVADVFPAVFSTVFSDEHSVSLTVPMKYKSHVFVDSSFYYSFGIAHSADGGEDEEAFLSRDSLPFSLYADYDENNQLYGLVWFIQVEPEPISYDVPFNYGEISGTKMLTNFTVLGSDDSNTYTIMHCGYPEDNSYRIGSLSQAEVYLNLAQDSIEILEGFIVENGLTEEPQWKQRFTEFTLQSVEDDIRSLKAKKTSGKYLDISDYPYTISSFVSRLTVDEERITNIALACEAIDGTLLEPGETFSFIDVVGERSAEKGYKEAFIYTTGDGERALGGGVSQVASTLYYTCLYADMEIIERHGLTYRSNAFPGGIDAEVEWGSKDLSFINTFDAPIYISASSSGSTVNIKLLTTEEPQFSVKVGMKCIETIPYETKYVDGTGVNQSGINGGTYTIVRYVYEDGNLIRTDTTEALDAMGGFGTTVYQPRNEVIYE